MSKKKWEKPELVGVSSLTSFQISRGIGRVGKRKARRGNFRHM